MPMKYYDTPPKFSEDPEEILEGEELESKLSFCSICFERIYSPILKGIWYHHGFGHSNVTSGNRDHEPVPAGTLLQLFRQYESDGKGTNLTKGKYDSKDTLACPCYLSWYKLLKKDVEAGFYSEHYFDENGINLCKTFLIRLQGEPITNPKYPEKQDYNCEKCIEILVKKKILKIIRYKGKSTNPIYNRIEWLKN